MSRAGVIALLLLGTGLSPAVLTPTATALAAPGSALVAPLAPEPVPAAPSDSPSPPGSPTTPGSPVAPGSATPTDGPEPDPSAAPEDEAGPDDPLDVTITRLTPSTLAAGGRVVISGRVTNSSDDDWSDLVVYAATSATAITTEAELTAADLSPLDVEPADYQRIVEPGLFEQVRDLGPGESTSYRLTIPRRRLGIPAQPGVYRLGVQVLGTAEGGREEGADGRARVLVSSVPRAAPPGELALAVQLRRRTVRTATGEIDYVDGWRRTLGTSGRLRHLVRLVSTAGGFPVALVLDPALVEAAGSLAEGNNGLELDENQVDGVDEISGALTPGPPPTPTPGAPAPDDDAQGDMTDQESGIALDAVSWLQELRAAATPADVLAVPYGDLDLGAAARSGDQETIGRGLATGISMLSEYGIQATGVLAPYHGLLGPEAAAAAPRGVPALVAQRSLTPADAAGEPPPVPAAVAGGDAPVWTYRGLPVVPGTAAGGTALEVRQRVLARSAVQALTRPGEPLVVVLPPQWQPGPAWRRSDFFAGLRSASWVRGARLDALQPQRDAPDLELRYPRRQLDLEVPPRVFGAARRLTATGAVLGDLVVDNDALAPRVQRQALLGGSFHTRGHVAGMTGRLRAADNVLTSRLRDVEVLAPRFVRMSSETGSFLVPVVNRLDVPVRVRLRPEVTGPDLTLEVPDPVVVEPGTRQPIRVVARADTIGIRSVRADLVTASGERLYPGPTFSVRSSQVARWVWVAMALGSAVLFVAILVRIVRRVRARKSTHGPVLLRGER